MTRSDLIDRIATRCPFLTEDEAAQIVVLVFDTIAAQLIAGGRVELRRFGAFSTRTRSPRMSWNPHANEPLRVSRKRLIYFRPGKDLREHVDALRTRNIS